MLGKIRPYVESVSALLLSSPLAFTWTQLPDDTLVVGTGQAVVFGPTFDVDSIVLQPPGGVRAEVAGLTLGLIGTQFEYIWDGTDALLIARTDALRTGDVVLEKAFLAPVGSTGTFTAAQLPFVTLPGTTGFAPTGILREESGSYLVAVDGPGGGRVFRVGTFGFLKELILVGFSGSIVDLGSAPNGSFLIVSSGVFIPSSVFSVPYDGGTPSLLITTQSAGTFTATTNALGEVLVGGFFNVAPFFNLSCQGALALLTIGGAQPGIPVDPLRHLQFYPKVPSELLVTDPLSVGTAPSTCAQLTTGTPRTTIELTPPDEKAAIKAVRANRHLYGEYGHAGMTSLGSPLRLIHDAEALGGGSYVLSIDGAPPSSLVTLQMGLFPAMVDLGVVGAAGNWLYVSDVVAQVQVQINAAGEGTFMIPMINQSLVGAKFHWQVVLLERDAQDVRITTSNAVWMSIR
ncbi:MAG: hypothetical protein GY711_18120 [bacterium]|nr:hypothetical protein [bacterium]